jgi:hypothetical protein
MEMSPPKDDKLYNFDYFFEKTMKDKHAILDSSDDDETSSADEDENENEN